MKATNMTIVQFVIYFLAVNGLGLNGEPVENAATDILTKTNPFSKSVITNSSVASILSKPIKWTVANPPKATPHSLPSTVSTAYNETMMNAPNYAANTKQTNNYNNEIHANEKSDNDETATKKPPAQAISKSDSKNNTNTNTNTLRLTTATVAESSSEWPESGNGKVERTKTRTTLAPINEQKILLTGNSHNEQLNNGISGSKALTNNGWNVPRSVSNSIIATPTTVPHEHGEEKEVSIANLAKMPEMRTGKTIEPFIGNASEKSTPIYITRALDDAYNKSPSSLLSSPLSTTTMMTTTSTTDKHSSKASHAPSNVDDPSFATNITTNLMNTWNRMATENNNNNNNNKVSERIEYSDKHSKSFTNAKTNMANSSTIYEKNKMVNYIIGTWITNSSLPIERNTMQTNFKKNPFNLNQNEMHSKAKLQPQPQHAASSAREEQPNQLSRSETSLVHKKWKTSARRLIKADETENENENDASVASGTVDVVGKTDDNTMVNKRAFVFAPTTETMIVNMAPVVPNNASTYSNLLHVNNSTASNSVRHNEILNRNKVELNMHNDLASNEAKTSTIVEPMYVNSNGLPLRTTESSYNTIDTMKGASKNSTSTNHLSQPSEVISLSTSSKLTMSSLLVDGENNGSYSSAETIAMLSNASESMLSIVQEEFIRLQQSNHNSSSIIPFEYQAENIDGDYHDFSLISAITLPADGDRDGDGDLQSFVNGTTDKVTPAPSDPDAYGHHLRYNVELHEGNYVNNFLTAAITVEHEVGNQFAIDYSNGTSGVNDR